MKAVRDITQTTAYKRLQAFKTGAGYYGGREAFHARMETRRKAKASQQAKARYRAKKAQKTHDLRRPHEVFDDVYLLTPYVGFDRAYELAIKAHVEVSNG